MFLFGILHELGYLEIRVFVLQGGVLLKQE